MPLPLVALAVPTLIEAAQFTAGVIVTTIGVAAVHDAINDSDSEKEAEKDVTIADSTKPCEDCPAIPRVLPEEEKFNGKKVNLMYQARICSTGFREDSYGSFFIEEFAFRDPGLINSTKKVKFDGWKPERCLFLEAKGRYDNLFKKNGEPWFSGAEDIYDQGFRQQNAIDLCDNVPQCHWHFMQPVSFKYFSAELEVFRNITAFYTP